MCRGTQRPETPGFPAFFAHRTGGRAPPPRAVRADGWLFTLATTDAANDTSVTSVWQCDREGRVRQLTPDGQGPAWAGQAQVAFLRSVGEELQVFLLPLDGGEARQVSSIEGGIASVEDCRDGELLVRRKLRLGPDPADCAPVQVDCLPYKTDGEGLTCLERIELGVVSMESGNYRPLLDGEGDVLEGRWSPDRAQVAYLQRRTGRQRHPMDLWLRAGDGRTTQATHDIVSASCLAWSPDGTRVAFAGSRIEGDSLNFLCILDVASADVHCSDVEMTLPAALGWIDERTLWTTQAHAGLQRLVTYAPSADKLETLWAGECEQVLQAGRSGEQLALVVAGPGRGPELRTGHVPGTAPTAVTRFNDWRAERPPVDAAYRPFRVPDGAGGEEEIGGWLLKPQGSGPFPLFLDIHGGPHSHVTFEHERYVHWPVLVDKGWAILSLNAVGSSSYGRAFAHRLRGAWGELDWPQWRAAIDALRQEGVASDTLAVFGHSYGGYLGAWALAREEGPVACGIVSGPVINLESHTGSSDSGYYVGPFAMRGELPDARERYRALSPISHAQRITAPVLILQGDDDQRCPLGQAEELLGTLVRDTDTAARMILFPGGSHHVSTTGRPSHRRAYFEAVVESAERWRGGGA